MALQTAPNPPSARVRYRAPAVLTFDGFDETFHVTVTNLSAEGLGCDGPTGLVLGDQMRLTFALAQQQQPISVLCEVVWLTPQSDAAAYGMRFVSLDDAVRIQLEQATLTRSSAPQPVATTPLDIAAQATAVPQPQPADPSAPSATHTLEGLWGHTPAFRQEAAEQEQLWAKVRGQQGPFWLRAVWASVVGLLFGGGLTLALLATQDAFRHQEGPGLALWQTWSAGRVAPVVEAIDRGDAAAATLSRALPVDGGRVLEPGAPSQTLAQDVTVLLAADGPIGERELFWLEAPTRLVVDLMGLHEAVAAPVVVPNHPLVRRVRVGQHDDRVRFVIEVGAEAASEVATRLDGSALAITFRTRESLRE